MIYKKRTQLDPYYNEQRNHKSLENVTSADVYFGRAKRILIEQDTIKQRALATCQRLAFGVQTKAAAPAGCTAETGHTGA